MFKNMLALKDPGKIKCELHRLYGLIPKKLYYVVKHTQSLDWMSMFKTCHKQAGYMVQDYSSNTCVEASKQMLSATHTHTYMHMRTHTYAN